MSKKENADLLTMQIWAAVLGNGQHRGTAQKAAQRACCKPVLLTALSYIEGKKNNPTTKKICRCHPETVHSLREGSCMQPINAILTNCALRMITRSESSATLACRRVLPHAGAATPASQESCCPLLGKGKKTSWCFLMAAAELCLQRRRHPPPRCAIIDRPAPKPKRAAPPPRSKHCMEMVKSPTE